LEVAALPTLSTRACESWIWEVPSGTVPRGDALTTSLGLILEALIRLRAVPCGETKIEANPVAVAATPAVAMLITVWGSATSPVRLEAGRVGDFLEDI